LSIPRNINADAVRRALIFENADLEERVGPNARLLQQILGSGARIIKGATCEATATADALDHALQEAVGDGCAQKILVDVTTFTHEALLILLRLLQLRCSSATVQTLYAGANEYSVGDPPHSKWLSRGVAEVRTVLGFPGEVLPSKRTHLIVIVGYEDERAATLIDILEPSSISLGYGRSGSATTEKDEQSNYHFHLLLKEVAASYCSPSEFEVPCNDPVGTMHVISREIAKAGDKNVVLAPMNNKLTTIGAALAVFDSKAVQVCYAQALCYNWIGYSSPGSSFYLFDLSPFLCLPTSEGSSVDLL
jgi:hypothetical protein